MTKVDEVLKAQLEESLKDWIDLEKKIEDIPKAIDSAMAEIQKSVSALPEVLGQSLTIIAAAVEDSEKTAEKLNDDFQESLREKYETALSKFNSEISGSISKNIESINNELELVENKVKNSSKHLVGRSAKITNVMLGAALCFTSFISIVLLTTTWVNSKQEIEHLKKYGTYWYESQKIGLQSLNPSERKKFSEAIEKAKLDGKI
ncbi:hypothetical protein [Aeromonas salmonicida]|uniref:hypothetical protein n=1 Tax=Aeromonas salmonicida TaxID=645 RepID=UPI000B3F6783|nr:hypothetical protein [Aeromonas salmonicida]ARW85349.1 hypothetical protein O23A_P3p0050 [Aeromonas salmonicida]